LKRWYIKKQWRKFDRFERQAFAKATRLISVSNEDAQLIRDRFSSRPLDVVDNGIDRSYFESVRGDRDPKQILFLGALDWRPNLDAIRLLLDQIFPAVRAVEPSARLCLVGRKPSETLVRRVKGLAGVELHPNVPDVRPYLACSGVMAVPLRIGGGSRLKILEALACGLPVVSTRVGAEGLDLVPGQDYIAADEPQAMTRELVACLRAPTQVQAMAERCRPFVLDRYDWSTLAAKLERAWLACAELPSEMPLTSQRT
jgi:glycosyltransferase involved in cell wall biosynthesis